MFIWLCIQKMLVTKPLLMITDFSCINKNKRKEKKDKKERK